MDTINERWKELMSAVAEQAIKDWLKHRDCDIEERKRVLLRNDALRFIKGDRFAAIVHEVAPGVQIGDVFEALGIGEETEPWAFPIK